VSRLALLLAVVLAACAQTRPVTRGEIELSVETTYDQWLYVGSDAREHRFVVRSAQVERGRELVDERAVTVPVQELPLRATMPVTADRARWVEFFSRTDGERAVGEGMRVGRIRRSIDLIPAPYGPPPDPH
jgi:hypothetical protein